MRAQVLDAVKRAIVARRSHASRLALMLGWIALATVLRLVLDRGAYGVPFLTFFPVMLLCAVFLGGWYAMLAAVSCAFIASRLFMAEPWFHNPDAPRFLLTAVYALSIATIVLLGHVLRRVIQENDAHIRQAESFNLELQHRTKNALQIVRALVSRRPPAEDSATFHAALTGRLDALAKANELLHFGEVAACSLRELVDSALEPFDPGRFRLSGPDCRLTNAATTPVLMALHELGTNAIKYGALAGAGIVLLDWTEVPGHPGKAAGTIVLLWREEGGPPVVPPVRKGLGSRLLVANGGLLGVELDFASDGVVCRMTAQAAPGAEERDG